MKAAVWAGQGCFTKPFQLKSRLLQSTGLGPAAGVGPARLQSGVCTKTEALGKPHQAATATALSAGRAHSSVHR